MGFGKVWDVAGSALSANRMWMELVANNMANAQTTRTPEGGPYQRKLPVFAEILGAETGEPAGVAINGVTTDKSPLQRVYKPGHPDADANGFVLMPNVNVVTEMVDMISIQRGYDANVTVLSAVKAMGSKALEIGR